MRKHIIILLLLFPLLGVKGYSRSLNVPDSLYTYKQGKINLEILGVSFQRESPISKKNTFIIRGGFVFNFLLTGGSLADNENHFGYTISPLLSLGGRHYYRLSPSSTAYKRNFGNFIGLDVGVRAFPILNKNLSQESVIFALPYWGLQRRISNFGSFELGLGIAVKRTLETSDPKILLSPNIQLRIGIFL